MKKLLILFISLFLLAGCMQSKMLSMSIEEKLPRKAVKIMEQHDDNATLWLFSNADDRYIVYETNHVISKTPTMQESLDEQTVTINIKEEAAQTDDVTQYVFKYTSTVKDYELLVTINKQPIPFDVVSSY